MRIKGIRATNLLSFDNLDLDLDLDDSQFALLVGPNGSGKTNIFRLVRQLIESTISWGNSGKLDLSDTLYTWKRDPNRDAVIEIDIIWTSPREEEFLANFFQMGLAGVVDISSASSELWRESVRSALRRSVIGPIISSEWSGALGVHHTGNCDLLLYFKPSIANSEWICTLGPRISGIVSKIPEMPISSFSRLPLAEIWHDTLPETTWSILEKILTGEAPPDSLSMPVKWSDIWKTFQLKFPTGFFKALGVLDINFQINDLIKTAPSWQKFLRELSITPASHENVTFARVLAHLLLNQCVISEELLSPPDVSYPPNEWWAKTKSPLTSRYLSAYLLGLKNGQQDSERRQFEETRKMFKSLSGGRELDVTLNVSKEGINTNDDKEIQINLIQQDLRNDPRSVPLQDSGSGLVEMAYLSTVLNSPGSHVILLDEAGRTLHPQALIQLRKLLQERANNQDGPQMIVITHSPYIIPPDKPQIIRRVSRDSQSGCSKITRLARSPSSDSRRSQQKEEHQELQRQDRWGRSPNWPALLFSSAVLLVDGETELGALPEWYQKKYNEPIEALGISILSIGEKPTEVPICWISITSPFLGRHWLMVIA